MSLESAIKSLEECSKVDSSRFHCWKLLGDCFTFHHLIPITDPSQAPATIAFLKRGIECYNKCAEISKSMPNKDRAWVEYVRRKKKYFIPKSVKNLKFLSLLLGYRS